MKHSFHTHRITFAAAALCLSAFLRLHSAGQSVPSVAGNYYGIEDAELTLIAGGNSDTEFVYGSNPSVQVTQSGSSFSFTVREPSSGISVTRTGTLSGNRIISMTGPAVGLRSDPDMVVTENRILTCSGLVEEDLITMTITGRLLGRYAGFPFQIDTLSEVSLSGRVTPLAAPQITRQPVAVSVNAGQGASFSVQASGAATLTYQWRKGTTNISAATSATYSLTNIQASQAGSYNVVVTNSVGSVTSDSVALSVNLPPGISNIPNQTIAEDAATAAIAFTVSDTGTAPAALTVAGTSSNTALVPVANIVFDGSGANRTVRVTPLPNQSGAATITVTVSDGALSASDTFLLTVTAVNDPPVITPVASLSTAPGTATPALGFAVSDLETAAASLTVTRTSSNLTLVPLARAVLGGGGSNRTVTVTPVAGLTGTSTITLTVSDGALSVSTSFVLTVTSAPPPAFRITSIRRINAGGQDVELKFLSQSGAIYRVQKSPSMAAGTWTDAGVSLAGNGVEQAVTLPGAGLSARQFFRVAKQ